MCSGSCKCVSEKEKLMNVINIKKKVNDCLDTVIQNILMGKDTGEEVSLADELHLTLGKYAVGVVTELERQEV